MARRNKHREEEHENHERWLVSYADFITLLFAFFVVMYAISQVNEGKYRVLSDSLVNAFQAAPNNTASPKSKNDSHEHNSDISKGIITSLPVKRNSEQALAKKEARRREEQMKEIVDDILEALGPLINEGQVRVTQNEKGIAVEINASVLFKSGQAILEPASIKVLSAVGKVLAQVENSIQVEGHTDDTPINTPAYPSNWELSTARASSVVRLFIDNGIEPERLAALGYGEFRAIESNKTPAGRTRNRRVTVMILSDAVQDTKPDLPLLKDRINQLH